MSPVGVSSRCKVQGESSQLSVHYEGRNTAGSVCASGNTPWPPSMHILSGGVFSGDGIRQTRARRFDADGIICEEPLLDSSYLNTDPIGTCPERMVKF